MRPKDGEAVELLELSGSRSGDIHKALTDWEEIGKAKTKGKAILYHCYIRLAHGESLETDQWLAVVDTLGESLGLSRSARAIVVHQHPKRGVHLHIVWSRFDPELGRLVSLSNDRRQFHAVARGFEALYGLGEVKGIPSGRDGRRGAKERRAIKDRGLDREAIRSKVQAAWNMTTTGQELRDVLKAIGMNLIPGDRRDWVLEVFPGCVVSAVRLLEGVDSRAFAARMQGVVATRERENSPAMPSFGRKARSLVRDQVDASLANDEARKPSKRGFSNRVRKITSPDSLKM